MLIRRIQHVVKLCLLLSLRHFVTAGAVEAPSVAQSDQLSWRLCQCQARKQVPC